MSGKKNNITYENMILSSFGLLTFYIRKRFLKRNKTKNVVLLLANGQRRWE